MYNSTRQRQPSPQNGKLSRYITRSSLLSANACNRTELPSQVHQEADALVDSILKHAPLLKRLRFAGEDGQPQCVHVLNAFDARVRGIRREDGEVGDDWDDDWEVDMDISYLQSEPESESE